MPAIPLIYGPIVCGGPSTRLEPTTSGMGHRVARTLLTPGVCGEFTISRTLHCARIWRRLMVKADDTVTAHALKSTRERRAPRCRRQCRCRSRDPHVYAQAEHKRRRRRDQACSRVQVGSTTCSHALAALRCCLALAKYRILYHVYFPRCDCLWPGPLVFNMASMIPL